MQLITIVFTKISRTVFWMGGRSKLSGKWVLFRKSVDISVQSDLSHDIATARKKWFSLTKGSFVFKIEVATSSTSVCSTNQKSLSHSWPALVRWIMIQYAYYLRTWEASLGCRHPIHENELGLGLLCSTSSLYSRLPYKQLEQSRTLLAMAFMISFTPPPKACNWAFLWEVWDTEATGPQNKCYILATIIQWSAYTNTYKNRATGRGPKWSRPLPAAVCLAQVLHVKTTITRRINHFFFSGTQYTELRRLLK